MGSGTSAGEWAWDGLNEIVAISDRYGMTPGERDWIDWFDGGKKGPRPKVPQTIPHRWWADHEWAVERD